jgi:hypothetical protein
MPPSKLSRKREHPLPAHGWIARAGNHTGVASRLMKLRDLGVALVAVLLVETGQH